MSFDKFALAFQKLFLNDKMYNYTKKKLGTWQFVKVYILVNFIIQKFERLKIKHFSQFFWCEVNMRELRAFILKKVQEEDTLIILLSA